MKQALSSKYIYDDFIYKFTLDELEKQVLDLYVKNESLIKISIELNISQRSVSRKIETLKKKFKNYCKMELSKNEILDKK